MDLVQCKKYGERYLLISVKLIQTAMTKVIAVFLILGIVRGDETIILHQE